MAEPVELSDELVDQLLSGYERPEDVTGPDGLLKQLTKRLVERAMSAELTEHLGYEHRGEPPVGSTNRRNGTSPKTVATEQGMVEIAVPRDREGRSSRRSCPPTSAASRASTTRSSPCTPAA